MYHPYFRGKQFELLTIRETADLMANAGFVPIIEPVKEALNGLTRTLQTIRDANGSAIVIINPGNGDHAGNGEDISELLRVEFQEYPRISAGILLQPETTVDLALQYFADHRAHNPVFIHAGFSEPKDLVQRLGDEITDTPQVFIDKYCGKPYVKHFRECERRILIYDGFERQKNADYPLFNKFSDLHLIYEEDGLQGFGDFLIVGDEFKEGGGPAYAVAIHITYIDPTKDDVMYVYHFVSTTNNTPTDPAGKFSQALEKMIEKLNSGSSHVFEGSAVTEYRELFAKKHFPGLGHVKKLSMKHHIEVLADFLG